MVMMMIRIRRGICPGDSLSVLLFDTFVDTLRKSKARHQLGKEEESTNHLLFVDNLKLYSFKLS